MAAFNHHHMASMAASRMAYFNAQAAVAAAFLPHMHQAGLHHHQAAAAVAVAASQPPPGATGQYSILSSLINSISTF